MQLDDPLTVLPRTHQTTIRRFARIGIRTISDLVTYLPVRYADYSHTSTITSLQDGETVTVQGMVRTSKNRFIRRNFSLQEVVIEDGTGSLTLIWYNQPYIVTHQGAEGTILAVAGTVERQGKKLVMKPMEYEQLPTINDQSANGHVKNNSHATTSENWSLKIENSGKHTGKIVPIYSQRGGLSTRLVREKIHTALHMLPEDAITEWLPPHVVRDYGLVDYPEAVKHVHEPQDMSTAQTARQRFAFDDLVTLQLANALVRQAWSARTDAPALSLSSEGEDAITEFIVHLPFTLTESQQAVWEHIKADLTQTTPMNRFLQGDVGSGKTVVAALAAYMAHLAGYRTLLMCPTEILARQHYATLKQMFEGIGVQVELITGSTNKHKTQHLALGTKHSSLVVGTHALISDKHVFDDVGLVVIDEQHRFGVTQRALLKTKSSSSSSASPHLLTMTATPIPRTMALTLYGDLAISSLTDMPAGRLPVKTYLAPHAKRESAYAWVRTQIRETGCQVYIVCPRITDDDTSDSSESEATIRAVTTEAERLARDVYPDMRIGVLHGKLKAQEKDSVMQRFRERELDILVSTTVVEVGIDIPNATIMVIEGAERYGLAQLHQLRGRVGRGSRQSYCVLFTSAGTAESARLSYFAQTRNGMDLAEYDLRHRGPGSIYGTAQHGIGEIDVAHLFDYALVSQTQEAAQEIAVDYDPIRYPSIASRLTRYAEIRVGKD